MQIMPDTGKELAGKFGERYSQSQLKNPDINIRYGTFYLNQLQNQLNQNIVMATAGYNAGASRAKAWQPEFNNLPADQYVDTIPYVETRRYVKAVMENTTNYGVLFGNPKSISQRMGTIYQK